MRRSTESAASRGDDSAQFDTNEPLCAGSVDPHTRQCAESSVPIKPPKGVVYESHDCPMGDVFSTEVSRPLHVMAPGLWAATLSLRTAEGLEIACVAATMIVREEDVKRPDDDVNATDSSGSREQHQKSDGPQSDQSSSASDSSERDSKRKTASTQANGSSGRDPAAAVSFAFFDRGVYCEDGIDILEGAMDDYSVSSINTE